MKIIDAHTHVFPDKLAERSSESIGKFYGLDWNSPASVSALLESGKKINACHYLVCSSALSPTQTEHINNYMASLISEHKEFTALGTIHPENDNFKGELRRVKSLGLKGIKIHSDFQKFKIDDERMLPAYREMARLGLPVLIHMGDERYDYSRPIYLASLMKKVPDLVCIAAHFGGWCRWDEAYEVLIPSERLYFDTSSALMRLNKDDAKRMIEKFGVDRFMFGTDFPIWEPTAEVQRVLDLGLTESENEKVFSGNFMKLFGLDEV